MGDRLMTRDEIRRALRLVASQRVRHRPLTIRMIAAQCGLARMTVYRAMATGEIDEETRIILSRALQQVPVQQMIEAGIDPRHGWF
jgi:predicted DNA-binding transcriptional regulator AlpA